jgi:hypothetical protein
LHRHLHLGGTAGIQGICHASFLSPALATFFQELATIFQDLMLRYFFLDPQDGIGRITSSPFGCKAPRAQIIDILDTLPFPWQALKPRALPCRPRCLRYLSLSLSLPLPMALNGHV